jgi:hypothetical protein
METGLEGRVICICNSVIKSAGKVLKLDPSYTSAHAGGLSMDRERGVQVVLHLSLPG